MSRSSIAENTGSRDEEDCDEEKWVLLVYR
jgi:hypothetical protein